MRIAVLVVACLVMLGRVASADDDPRFRRTTPRAAFADVSNALVVGVPGGRAWGIESALRPLPASTTTVVVRLAVSDAAVREAFLRVAYYGSSAMRTRQIAIVDSAPVSAGEHALVGVTLEPPPGAVAYRVRVLARLADPSGTSATDAITATLHFSRASARPAGTLYSSLLP